MVIGALPETCDAMAWIRPGQVGYIGPDLGVGIHGAAVGVLTLGLDAPVTLETPEHGKITARSVYAPSRVAHRVLAPAGCRILLLFADSADAPSDRMAAAMQRHVGAIGLDHRAENWLIKKAGARGSDVDRGAFQNITGPLAAAGGAADPRIEELVEEIRTRPAQAFRAEASARRLGVSRSHFLHMFAHHTGTTFRRYQQWSRVLHVVRGISAGHDLTRCAADAGFASPSHLSDSFRQNLGTTATTVFGSQIRFDLEEAPR
jgi:AraC-like DNA-binding protein